MFTDILQNGWKKFLDDDLYGKASSLSFYTLMSIVPVLAVAFGIAKGFGFEEILEKQILETFYQQKELAVKVITFAKSTLEQTKGSLIAGVGALLLFWTSFGLLASLERSLNAIFCNPGGRPIGKRIVDFLPILIFLPFFFVASSSLTYLIVTKVVAFTVEAGFYSALKPFIYLLYYGLLIVLSWSLLAFLYFYLPERLPPFFATLAGSLAAALAFQTVQWTYIHFQVYLTSYNAIYGSFAAIPLFLLWLQASWLIVLNGAELAYLLSQAWTPDGSKEFKISEEELLQALCRLIAKEAESVSPLKSRREVAKELNITQSTADYLLKLALTNDLIIIGQNGSREEAFYPARPLDLLISAIPGIVQNEHALFAGPSNWHSASPNKS